MTAMILGFCLLGLAVGFTLLLRVPLCSTGQETDLPLVSVIIPARNEERNLPRLLASMQHTENVRAEIIVVDDDSSDATSAIASSAGATVIRSRSLPHGWTGKTWACAQGAEAASGELLAFVDADTWFAQGGLNRLVSTARPAVHEAIALSILPHHAMSAPYEQLSLFFNLLMAFGAGGFGAFGQPRLFGQCLVISRRLYAASGGHTAVRSRILENFTMADCIKAAGGSCICLGGSGTLQLRMFPEGLGQLCESWKKAFADGAAATGGAVLASAVVWLSGLCAIFLFACLATGPLRGAAILLYLLAAAQVYFFARQVGEFHWAAGLFYPVPLLFFFALFADSLVSRLLGRQVAWRGRQI